MNDKYAKEVAKELRLIRVELQKFNKVSEPQGIQIDGEDVAKITEENERFQPFAGERVTIK